MPALSLAHPTSDCRLTCDMNASLGTISSAFNSQVPACFISLVHDRTHLKGCVLLMHNRLRFARRWWLAIASSDEPSILYRTHRADISFVADLHDAVMAIQFPLILNTTIEFIWNVGPLRHPTAHVVQQDASSAHTLMSADLRCPKLHRMHISFSCRCRAYKTILRYRCLRRRLYYFPLQLVRLRLRSLSSTRPSFAEYFTKVLLWSWALV